MKSIFTYSKLLRINKKKKDPYLYLVCFHVQRNTRPGKKKSSLFMYLKLTQNKKENLILLKRLPILNKEKLWKK